MKDVDEITRDVIGIAMSIHRDLGPGLLESVYEAVLAAALSRMGYHVERQRPVDLEYDGLRFEAAYRVDLLVDARLVIEIKSVDQITAVHSKQLLTYLRLLKQPVGLILNFSGAKMKEGIRSLVNNHIDSASSASLRETKKEN